MPLIKVGSYVRSRKRGGAYGKIGQLAVLYHTDGSVDVIDNYIWANSIGGWEKLPEPHCEVLFDGGGLMVRGKLSEFEEVV